MIFRMGADDRAIKNVLAGGEDFREPICRESYGVAVDEPVTLSFRDSRRRYVFNPRSCGPGMLSQRLGENRQCRIQHLHFESQPVQRCQARLALNALGVRPYPETSPARETRQSRADR